MNEGAYVRLEVGFCIDDEIYSQFKQEKAEIEQEVCEVALEAIYNYLRTKGVMI